MPVLEVLKFPDPVLTRDAKEVSEINGRVAGMLNSMVDTMYVARGIGLAAPQVGILERAIVVDTSPEDRGRNLIKIINPVIAEKTGTISYEEGCLSIVNFTAEVQRAQRILVRGWTVDQKEIELEAENLEAVCIQHEIDHLDGTLLTDHISRLKREMYRKRLKRGFKTGSDSARGNGGL